MHQGFYKKQNDNIINLTGIKSGSIICLKNKQNGS